MSGGAYDYGYFKILGLAEDIEEHANDEFTSTRRTVAVELRRAAELARIVEWADSGDTGWKEAAERVKELLTLWESLDS